MKDTVPEFLDRHGLGPDRYDSGILLASFGEEMRRGLYDEPSSLLMIPAWIDLLDHLPADRRVIALDAGGTNLRIARIRFTKDGTPMIEHLERHPMPGTQGEISHEEFFDVIAGRLRPVIRELSPDESHVGFCFSYPTEITPERDGRLVRLTKELKITGLIGEPIARHIETRIPEATGKVTLLNDTIATLLAGKTHDRDGEYAHFVGFILGTGTNSAYIEQNRNIGTIEVNEGSQAVNIESGNFDKLPKSDFDRALDASSACCGEQVFEKMISGAYLGPLVGVAVGMAADEGLISDKGRLQIRSMAWATRDLSSLLVDKPLTGIQDDSAFKRLDARDAGVCGAIARALVERAAHLSAVNIAAAVLKSGPTGKGRRVCITADGTTFHRLPLMQDLVRSHLDDILTRRNGVDYDIIAVDDAPLIGAAVAALLY